MRGPESCPWDREQDYHSLRGLLLEEAYEVIDAINERNFKGLEEELGDVLFQVVFCSRLAEEEGRFNIDDVIEGVHAKLVRRHPHVFGEVRARNADEALQSWTEAKGREKERSKAGSVMEGISKALPSTLEAHELGLRAAKAGFDWKKVEDLLQKIEEEIQELRHELHHRDGRASSRVEEEAGDLLFAAANLTRFIDSDPEICLRRANQKFKRRFQALETEMERRGKRLQECSLDEMEALWQELKAKEV